MAEPFCLCKPPGPSFGSSACPSGRKHSRRAHTSGVTQGVYTAPPYVSIMLELVTKPYITPFFGLFRGYKGRVVSSTDSDVRMELEAQYKTVTVKRGQLTGQESSAAPSSFGRPKANVPPWQMSSGRTPVHPGAATPLHGSATPLHPSATPMHPSATPLHPGKLTSLHSAANTLS